MDRPVEDALAHALPGARPGLQLPLLAAGEVPGLGHHAASPAEDHPGRAQREYGRSMGVWGRHQMMMIIIIIINLIYMALF